MCFVVMCFPLESRNLTVKWLSSSCHVLVSVSFVKRPIILALRPLLDWIFQTEVFTNSSSGVHLIIALAKFLVSIRVYRTTASTAEGVRRKGFVHLTLLGSILRYVTLKPLCCRCKRYLEAVKCSIEESKSSTSEWSWS